MNAEWFPSLPDLRQRAEQAGELGGTEWGAAVWWVQSFDLATFIFLEMKGNDVGTTEARLDASRCPTVQLEVIKNRLERELSQ